VSIGFSLETRVMKASVCRPSQVHLYCAGRSGLRVARNVATHSSKEPSTVNVPVTLYDLLHVAQVSP
jgi:hypothetical protein